MRQIGVFDWQRRFEQLDKGGAPLVKFKEVVNWKYFVWNLKLSGIKSVNRMQVESPLMLMFKMLIIQSEYNLADDQAEYQVRDRLSFMRFLGLSLGDAVPDAKTLWLFREELNGRCCPFSNPYIACFLQ